MLEVKFKSIDNLIYLSNWGKLNKSYQDVVMDLQRFLNSSCHVDEEIELTFGVKEDLQIRYEFTSKTSEENKELIKGLIEDFVNTRLN